MSHTHIDDKGRTWHEFTCSYKHEIDDLSYTFSIWAIDFADAAERLNYIGSNGVVDGAINEVINY